MNYNETITNREKLIALEKNIQETKRTIEAGKMAEQELLRYEHEEARLFDLLLEGFGEDLYRG